MNAFRSIFALISTLVFIACSERPSELPEGRVISSLSQIGKDSTLSAVPIPTAYCDTTPAKVRQYFTRRVLAPELTEAEVSTLFGSSGALTISSSDDRTTGVVYSTVSTRTTLLVRRFSGSSTDTVAKISDTIPVVRLVHHPTFGTVISPEGRHQLLRLSALAALPLGPETPTAFSDFAMGDGFIVGSVAVVGIERERADSTVAQPAAWRWTRGDTVWRPVMVPSDEAGWRARLGLPGPNPTRVRILRSGGFAIMYVATGVVDIYSASGKPQSKLQVCTSPAYRRALEAQFEAGRKGLRQQQWDFAAADILDDPSGDLTALSLYRGTGVNGQLTTLSARGALQIEALARPRVRLPLNSRFGASRDQLLAIAPKGRLVDIELRQ